MRRSVAAKILAKAAMKDFRENPQLVAEAGSRGDIKKLIAADVMSAFRDVPVPGVFPNLRAAAVQIAEAGLSGMGEDEQVGTNDTWAKEQGFPASTPAPATGGDDWMKAISSIVSSAAQAGASIYTAKIASDSQTKQASLLSRAQSLLFPSRTATPVATSSMMGGGMMPILLLGGAVLAGGAFVVMNAGKGGKSRRRRR